MIPLAFRSALYSMLISILTIVVPNLLSSINKNSTKRLVTSHGMFQLYLILTPHASQALFGLKTRSMKTKILKDLQEININISLSKKNSL